MRSLVLAVTSAALLLACSDDPGGGGPDAGVDAPYDTARCLIQGHYGDLGTKSGHTMMGAETLTITLDDGPPRDTFFLKLNTGKGAFAAGLATGTFPLMGADLDAPNCGLCINLIADIVAMQGPTKFYFASGGTVTLTSTAPPAGSLTDVTFVETTSAGQLVPGGCTGSITSMTFN